MSRAERSALVYLAACLLTACGDGAPGHMAPGRDLADASVPVDGATDAVAPVTDTERDAEVASSGARDASAAPPIDASEPAADAAQEAQRDASDDADGGGEAGSDASPDAAVQPTGRALTLRFRGRVGAEPFSCAQSYDGIGSTGSRVRPVDFRFFVSGIALLDAQGARVPFQIDPRGPFQAREVALVSFVDGQGWCNIGGAVPNLEISGHADIGAVTGVVFSTAVPLSLNHGNPATAPRPLQAGGASWDWLTGYKFFMAEAGEELPEGASGVPGYGLLHVGSTHCALTNGEYGCEHQNRNEVALVGFDPDAHTIVADFAAVFSGVALNGDASCHSFGPSCPELFVSLGLDFTTGSARSGQRVFSFE